MNPTPKISVIMPAYNAERFVGDAVRSVLEQTWTDWELLVIDDGSSDQTVACVQRFDDPRVRLLQPGRLKSPSAVRNIGLAEARGEYVAFLDADDLYEKQTLERFVRHLDANPDCNAVYGFFREIDENGHFIQKTRAILIPSVNGGYILPDAYRHTWEGLLTGKTIHQMCFAARKSVMDAIGGFDGSILMGEDLIVYIRLFQLDFHGVQALPVYVYRYRKYGESVCYDDQRFQEVLESLSRFFRWLAHDAGLPKEALACLSPTIAAHYGYYMRTRHENDQPSQVFRTGFAALREPDLRLSDWMRDCAPLMIRALIPAPLEQRLKRLVQSLRRPAMALGR